MDAKAGPRQYLCRTTVAVAEITNGAILHAWETGSEGQKLAVRKWIGSTTHKRPSFRPWRPKPPLYLLGRENEKQPNPISSVAKSSFKFHARSVQDWGVAHPKRGLEKPLDVFQGRPYQAYGLVSYLPSSDKLGHYGYKERLRLWVNVCSLLFFQNGRSRAKAAAFGFPAQG